MKISERGLAFIAAHEGFVSRAYLDPAGVLTIGYGFTMRSRLFAAFWRARHGRSLVPGDRISREDANKVLLKLIDEEYAPPVAGVLPGVSQPVFDACVSVVYNLGARALSWRWARALMGGDKKSAAGLLAKTGTTAAGRRLPGLVRRRREEAHLLKTGDYGLASPWRWTPNAETRRIQTVLARLGFKPGPIDGLLGKRTRAAVRAFQRANPPLLVDGEPGPATMAALERAADKRKSAALTVLSSAATALGLFWQKHPAGFVAAAAAGVVAIGVAVALCWAYRGRLLKALSA
ncbi:GH24 family phage-related lysozyme (muramidase) [Roseibium hamelinense]|uniref:Lysozyme n=1 Tax=Roseibium hamelinense TaxID=150831 RepID=A0A562T9D1_9HYPH|nr:peptidoglycan-binding protein [Roseibium hamelinense]MTI43708.1 lysozyme [Roseibium hamelinense]TWI89390.1 GH24 family phage-related lysozyme (muramidase) [Roseibium hamelinense]